MNFETPNSSKLLATPANSPMMLKKLVTKSAIISRKGGAQAELLADEVAQPLPVTAPIRDDISWMMTSAIVIGIIVHSSE